MTKKQRNKKEINQNKRNRIINKRYLSIIKTLFKLFYLSIQKKEDQMIDKDSSHLKEKNESFIVLKNLFSILDKAVKKNVIHKNTASRKKSKLSKLYSKI
jgi:small subunit ribosomal protein S20